MEWDLGISCVFFWYRFPKTVRFDKVFNFVLENYDLATIAGRTLEYALLQAQKFLEDIVKNKNGYENRQYWEDRYNFAKSGFEEIQKFSTF